MLKFRQNNIQNYHNEQGFFLVDSLVAISVIGVAIVASTSMWANLLKMSKTNSANTAYIELRTTIMQVTANRSLCMNVFNKKNVDLRALTSDAGEEISMAFPDRTVVRRDQVLPTHGLTIKSFRIVQAVDVGLDPDPSYSGNRLYSGMVILRAERNGDVLGGKAIRESSLGYMTLSLSNSKVSSCFGTEASSNSNVAGGTGKAAMGRCPAGSFMIGYDPTTGIVCDNVPQADAATVAANPNSNPKPNAAAGISRGGSSGGGGIAASGASMASSSGTGSATSSARATAKDSGIASINTTASTTGDAAAGSNATAIVSPK